MKNFYQILSEHKYSSSNGMSTSGFYSVEMGLPFFIYGPDPKKIDRSEGVIVEPNEVIKSMKKLFAEPMTSITKEQKETVEFELGVHYAVDSNTLRQTLFKNLFFEEIPSYPKRFFSAAVKEFIKNR